MEKSGVRKTFCDKYLNESAATLKTFLLKYMGEGFRAQIVTNIHSDEAAKAFVLMVKEIKSAKTFKGICEQILKRPFRPTKSIQEQAKVVDISRKLLKGDVGLEKRWIFLNAKYQRGVFATKVFQKGDFICEYKGKCTDVDVAKKENRLLNEEYVLHFTMGSTKYCIDATQDDGSIGRLINHRDPGNIKPVKYGLRSNIGVYFVAIKSIKLGEELFWNYNDQNPEARQSNPWLKKTSHAAKEPESSLLPACQIVFDVGSKLENSYTDGVVVNMNDYLTLRIEMAANIGQKPTMEDVIQCKGIFANGEFVLSACVFDGHGGSNAAHYASTNLIKNIISENDSDGLLGLNGLRNAFEITNNNMKADYRTWPKSKKGGPSTSGTTATVLLLSKENYSLGYVGDSKLFTFSRAKTPKLYCQIIPHNLQNAGEIQRVCRDGGFIDVRRNNYTLCVTVKDQPVSLNMTRSLGNFWSYTSKGNYAISSSPSVCKSTVQGTQYFVMGSDGIDCISQKNLESILDEPGSLKTKSENLKQLLEESTRNVQNSDNYSFIIIELVHADLDFGESSLSKFNAMCQRLNILRYTEIRKKLIDQSVAKKIVRKYTTPPKSFPMKQPGAMKTTEKKSHVRKLFPESHTMGVSCSPPITPLSELPESDKNKKTELPTGVLIVQEMSDAARNDKEALSKQLIPESPPLVTDNQSKTDSTGRKHGKLGRFVSKPKEERKPRPPYIYTGYKRKPADFSPPRTRKATQTNTKTTKINFPRKCSKPLTLKFPFNKSKGKQRKTRLSSSTSEESE